MIDKVFNTFFWLLITIWIILTGLKTFGIITLGWLWVFSPFIAIVALFLLLLFAYVMFFVILDDFLKP